MKELLLIGGGGHCISIIDTLSDIEDYNIAGIVDIKEKIGETILGVQIIGEDNDLKYFYKQGIKHAFISIGSIGDVSLRRKLYQTAKEIGYLFPTIIDKSAIVSKYSSIGSGTFIGKGSIINGNTSIGSNVIINSGSIVEHDCVINDYCHIAPGSSLSGNVRIGENTHIGTNSTIIENIVIGENTIIGAGSVVVDNIADNQKAFGNPCKVV
jgi:sugar O-acyltransferase (sialic acid O-acetyltransferase NeuD family)